MQGRPHDINHPARKAKLESQRLLQRLSREENTAKVKAVYDDLMTSSQMSINDVFKKLKSIKHNSTKSADIPYIETINGTYEGQNILEGFRANTELLCNSKDEENSSDFLKMCQKDNVIIKDMINFDNDVDIPEMNLSDLKSIVFKKLKPNKAGDIFKLTMEHLRFCGDESLTLIFSLINSVISHLNYLSSTQLNTAVASVIHKGKNKPVVNHKSYRLVRVSPLIGRIIDEYLRPNIENITKPIQNRSQYGFTVNVSYMLAALQRHETEKFCIDNKKTFFGCSLDGESAFEVVNRTIQLRELYCSGETGSYWAADSFSYQNSQTRIKMNGYLSGNIEEHTGVKQGNIKSSSHYKIYINPLLDTVDTSNLGVCIGQTNVSHSACDDDEYLMTDSQSKMQSLINIAQFYGEMYDVVYGASKTKITVIGSQIDQSYYQEMSPWKLCKETIQVTEDNDHLGQVVSGTDQEQKNVDLRIAKARNALYGLMGPAFQHKSLLSPKLKCHLFRTYISPVLRSGLSSFVIRSTQMQSLTIFHRKVLRGILKLSKSSNVPALYFLLGEIPIEGQYHKDIFALFYNVWTNPETKIYQVVKFLIENSAPNSRTWSSYVKNLASKYDLEDPTEWIKQDPPSKR